MGDPPGSSRVSSQKQNREGVVGAQSGQYCRVSSQKQNREGVVGAQSGQYCATVVERARDVVDPGSGCDKISIL